MPTATVTLYDYVCSNAPKCTATWTKRLEHLEGESCTCECKCGGTIQLSKTFPDSTITVPEVND